MRFLNPSGLWLLLGVPILILIYLIKSRHEDRPVSSTYIWKLSSRFMKKRLPLQKVRKVLLFLLQLFMIVTAALMVARPAAFNGEICEYVAILDLSAGMETADEEGITRLNRAVEQISELAKETESGHKITVILASDKASYLVQSATTADDVTFALESVETSLGGCNLDLALELAASVCERSNRAEVFFYTDQNYSDTPGINVVNVSAQEWNVAVTGLSLTDTDQESLLTASLTSYHRETTVTVGLKIDGKIEKATIVTCPIDTPTEVVFATEPLGSNYTAEVFIEETDGLSWDNSYCLCSESTRKCNVLLFSQTPFYLNSALNALGNCQVTVISSPEEMPAGNYDLYLYDGIYPATYPTDGAIIQFGAGKLPEGLGAKESVSIESPLEIVTQQSEPASSDAQSNTENLLTDINLNDTVVSHYTPLTGDSRWESILECDGASVCMAAKTVSGKPHTVLSFDLHDSNLALQQDFVVLMRNLVNYSVPPFIEKTDFSIGEYITLNSLPAAENLYVKYPDGKIETISTMSNVGGITAKDLGVHTAFMTIGVGGESADFFVHIPESEMLPAEESIIEWDMPSGNLNTAPEEAFTELWFWLAAVLLLIILLEWGVYYYEQY